ncbi:hypothetical protein CNMCM5793_004165 [Aspergillus hiratsukae]|uniref:Uncharacterized protein n=1 Tax=Aspergillus hiratsukae TaxID=1194566 RepID=A0A8H6PS54_9EURO|nr:hypothetical protein CNMCM5793_004165 [Aspergillus hiratsukae]KAF7159124.1 hypothetical protein CNMCM6106_006209 [Aspergillus hiratsukae]
MRDQYIFRAPFLSSQEIKLGNLIPNIKDPELDAQECPWSLILNKDFTIKTIANFHSFFRAEKDVRLAGFLTSLLKASGLHKTANSDEFASARGNIHTLKQPNLFFKSLCQDQGVRKWLQEQIEDGMDVHVVVGFVTFLDAKSAGTSGTTDAFQGQGVIPVTQALSSGFPSDALDIKLAGGYQAKSLAGRSYFAPGEQIFALRIKKLAFKFYRSKNVANAKLEKDTSWEMISDNRAATGNESEWVEAYFEGESADDAMDDHGDMLQVEDDVEIIFLDDDDESDGEGEADDDDE